MTKRYFRAMLLATTVFTAVGMSRVASAVDAEPQARVYERHERARGCDNEYLFAATYGVTDMAVPPALKVPLVPVTLVMDLVLLPFEAVAGCF